MSEHKGIYLATRFTRRCFMNSSTSVPGNNPRPNRTASQDRRARRRCVGMHHEVGNDDWSTQNLARNPGGQMMNDDETDVAFDRPARHTAVKLGA